MDELYVKFIELLKHEAKKRNLSCGQIAYMLGAGRSSVQHWLSFNRQMAGEFVLKAILIFNLSIDELKGAKR